MSDTPVRSLAKAVSWRITGTVDTFLISWLITGQVVIQIRDCQGWQGSNPFAIEQVKYFIRRDLDPVYQGQYEIQVVPNIVNITYGRDVGYRIDQESFDESITDISATKIRRSMGLE